MNPQDFISLKEEVLGIIVIARMITIAAFKRCTTNAYQSGRPDTLIQPKLLSKPAWSKAAETEIRSIHFSKMQNLPSTIEIEYHRRLVGHPEKPRKSCPRVPEKGYATATADVTNEIPDKDASIC